MSVQFSNDDGWVISHLEYLCDIYSNVENNNSGNSEFCQLRFDQSFFQINSQYLRQNQFLRQEKELVTGTSRVRKRKKSSILSGDEIQEINNVQQRFHVLLSSARNHGSFSDNVTKDNNEKARMASTNFYANTFQHRIENLHGGSSNDNAIISRIQGENYVFPKRCSFYCYDVRNIADKIDMENQFDFILLDPPWWNKFIRRKKGRFVEASYKMMYDEELGKIPVNKLLDSKGIVAVWCTNGSSHLRSILEDIFPSWGITYRAKWYWIKVTQDGTTICDFNFAPGKQPYELLIFGSIASNTEVDIPDGKLIISVPSAVHSHKPPLSELINRYLPKEPRCLEIFARYLLPGWTSWGLEVLKFQHMSLYSSPRNNQDDNVHSETEKPVGHRDILQEKS